MTPSAPAGGAVAGFFDPASGRAVTVDAHTWPNNPAFYNCWIVRAVEGESPATVQLAAVEALVADWREQAARFARMATDNADHAFAGTLSSCADQLQALTRGDKACTAPNT